MIQATKERDAMGRELLKTVYLGIHLKRAHGYMCDIGVAKISVLVTTTRSPDDCLTMETHGSNQTLHNKLWNVLPLMSQSRKTLLKWLERWIPLALSLILCIALDVFTGFKSCERAGQGNVWTLRDTSETSNTCNWWSDNVVLKTFHL